MIEKVIEAMLKKDYVSLSKCFAQKCRYFDYCPIGTKKENYHIYGSAGIEMFFHNKFVFNIFSISDPIIDDENTANYLVSYGGTYLHVQAKAEQYSDDGLIQELVVRPA